MCVMAILAVSTTSCVVYHPHNVDIPLLHEKGELQADASLSLSAPLLAAPAVNASIAYAPMDVLGLQGGISITSPTNLYAQGAAGAYLPFTGSLVMKNGVTSTITNFVWMADMVLSSVKPILVG